MPSFHAMSWNSPLSAERTEGASVAKYRMKKAIANNVSHIAYRISRIAYRASIKNLLITRYSLRFTYHASFVDQHFFVSGHRFLGALVPRKFGGLGDGAIGQVIAKFLLGDDGDQCTGHGTRIFGIDQ